MTSDDRRKNVLAALDEIIMRCEAQGWQWVVPAQLRGLANYLEYVNERSSADDYNYE